MKLKEFYTDKSKWAKYIFYGMDGSCCLIGALQECYPTPLEDIEARKVRLKVKDKIHKAILEKNIMQGIYDDSIINWNDTLGRTKEEVKSLVEELDV